MRHFEYMQNDIFYKIPEHFTKWDDPKELAYSLGATLYMPGTLPKLDEVIQNRKYPDLTSLVIDLEDAVGDDDLLVAEDLVITAIEKIFDNYLLDSSILENMPLVFIRVRNPEQLQRLIQKIGEKQVVLTGYVFPKFGVEVGAKYFAMLAETAQQYTLKIYGMPILETPDVIYKERRLENLFAIKELLNEYRKHVLNVRIGATDFCGIYGIRRRADSTIYDISIIRDCMTDIINVFRRQPDAYVISGPVWEYFSNQRVLKPMLRQTPFLNKGAIDQRQAILDEYIDGLVKEVLLDKQNGILGKTIIHPTHIRFVHGLYAVTHEEYCDAVSIMEHNNGSKGVLKSQYENKMNEMKPHSFWAEQIIMRAKFYGVLNESEDFTTLLLNSDGEMDADRSVQTTITDFR
ncbi:HpcH/HpaI aldolase/citrate lyase family protein [Viridibacillus sp. YIM B01967]|uniref:HpcH/HpaI aldolase/citrate lyase family protein n=1 Tax=Viridibacillus soli TaxID=2798301 RepID=A0ABS1H1W9_9BACL|nr:HpcH/HpaI aldolase/citrate lyase family protein [Viridibacillus soli]MBK3493289.1 HpcH/HpaI aldolase/citrate lyase family protein [Viridibacillus soli]